MQRLLIPLLIGAFCQIAVLDVAAHEAASESATHSALGSSVTISIEGKERIIRANGIPNHATGSFPNQYNPNRMSARDQVFRMPTNPLPNKTPTALGMHPFGVALNGVVFDPAAAEWWNRDRESGWQYEPMHMKGRLGADESNGHVQPTGAYHYHAIPTGLVQAFSKGKSDLLQVGWAADGFPIYSAWGFSVRNDTNSIIRKLKSSFQLKKGTRPGGPRGRFDGTFIADYEYVKGSGDLDECNGRFGITPEFPGGTYYYVLTEQFPYVPRAFMGTPDSSFFRKGPPNGRPRPGGPPHDSVRSDSNPNNKQPITQSGAKPQKPAHLPN